MTAVPDAIPVTTPPGDTVAIPVAVLLQIPPVGVAVSAIVLASHTESGPAMAPITGRVSTVMVFVATAVPHMLVTEQLTVAVPYVNPLTSPVGLTLTAGPGVLQVPPVGVHVSVMTEVIQTKEGPLITDTVGSGFTVITRFVAIVPQLLVTV